MTFEKTSNKEPSEFD